MSALAVGLLAGYCVVRLLRADRSWPWRVLDLDTTHAGDRQPRRPRRMAARRRAPGRWRWVARVRSPTVRARPVRAQAHALERDLPGTVDLLRLAIDAGHTVHGALALVAVEADGPAARALRDAVDGFSRGGRLAEQLHELPIRAGEPLRPLCTVLAAALASGEPPVQELARLAESERRRLRRRGEERVRRLPILLLGPLVGLVLPAFVLLTVVPVGLTTARSAQIPALPAGSAGPLPPGTDTTTRNPP